MVASALISRAVQSEVYWDCKPMCNLSDACEVLDHHYNWTTSSCASTSVEGMRVKV